MNQLHEAIKALEQARQNSGNMEHDVCKSVLNGLSALRDQILAYNKKLNDEGAAPTGDDYNEIIEMLGLAANQYVWVGKLWFNADNLEEAQKWQADYLGNGAISVELKPEDDRSIVSVIITLDRNRAKEIVGYDVDDDEWLDLSED